MTLLVLDLSGLSETSPACTGRDLGMAYVMSWKPMTVATFCATPRSSRDALPRYRRPHKSFPRFPAFLCLARDNPKAFYKSNIARGSKMIGNRLGRISQLQRIMYEAS